MCKSFKLVGSGLAHSMSLVVHRRLFEIAGFKNYSYELLDVELSRLDAIYEKLRYMDGFNVTMPYKQYFFDRLDVLDNSALDCGSVNLVKPERNGLMIGYNTDWFGFLKAADSISARISGSVLLLGFGGAGKMVAAKISKLEGFLTIAVRQVSVEKVKLDARNFFGARKFSNFKVVSLGNIPKKKYDVIVNATPVGMYPNLKFVPLNPVYCSLTDAAIDLIYNPCETEFLKIAKFFGAKTVCGAGMLVWQAVLSNEIWNNIEFETSTIEVLIEEVLEKLKRNFC